MKHETLTIWSAEDFARPEKLAALRVGDEVAFQLKNGKDAAFVVADIADGVLTGCLFKDAPDWMQRDDTPDKPLPFFAKSQSNRKAYLWFAWLRSPYAGYSYYFCIVNTSGTAYYGYASLSLGVAPGFRVGIKAKTAEPAQD